MTLDHIDRGVALIAGTLCITVMIVGWGMRGDAGVFPLIAGGLGLIASGWLGCGTLHGNQTAAEPDLPKPSGLRMAIWAGTLLALLALMQPLGTFIVLPLFLLSNLRLLAALRWWPAILISLGFTVAIYAVFDRLLTVPLPHGLLEPWLDG